MTSGLETEWDYSGRMEGMEKQENKRSKYEREKGKKDSKR